MILVAIAAVALKGDAIEVAPSGGDSRVADGAFVCAAGDRFQLGCGGSTWSPVGFDDYRLTSAPGGYVCDEATGEIDDEELGEHLEWIAATGANTVRTWFFQSYTEGGTDFSSFDRLLEAASDRGLRVIPVLVNHFPDCEPRGLPRDVGFYENGYRHAEDGYDLSYRDYAARVAARYRDDPAIAFWQLVNEAQAPDAGGACDEPRAASALAGFAADVSSVIRAQDPNHLISLGPEGLGSCGTVGADYAFVQEAVDVCGIHQYGMLTAAATGTADVQTPQDFLAAIAQCGAGGLGKPIIAGEIGVPSDLSALGARTGMATSSTLATRAGLLDAIVMEQCELGLDGALLWQAVTPDQPAASASEYDIAPGDPVNDLIERWAVAFSDAGPQAAP